MKKLLTFIIIIIMIAALAVGIFYACGGKFESRNGRETEASRTGEATETETVGTEAPQTETPTEPIEPGPGTTAPPETVPETESATRPPETEETDPGTDTDAPHTEEETEGPVVELDPRALAIQCIGKDVSELYEQIGYPRDARYAPSCMGDGDDGELYYQWFVVYTYSENGTETVVDVN